MMTTSAMPTSIPIDSIQRPFGPVRSDRLHGHWLRIPGEAWLDRVVPLTSEAGDHCET